MSDDEKLEAILAAAYECFRLHGVRRTTMDDIARHAGMSRPAVYQHVRNKEDAFRQLAERLVAETLERFTGALASDAPLAERLAAALATKLNLTLRLWRESPHAEELLGAGAKISADLTARDHAVTREALIAAIGAERPDVDAAEFVELLMALGRGLQIESADPEIPTRRLRQGVVLLVAGLDHSTTS
ncbi:TetR/AcrR family transcriptional regulator [Streptacidiphilus fuscans]|uniref:TetR/AcrR family transcriptional regulator n=1 Tax=Streptacidiphilus fuscans TaxID=2789292 RepID=A0A931FAQ8_9ACTN|nr:TetR/AcrR family transcriptional regulator [Streptacidiphilus fuscans]MBF9066648.1 TetR/AcrR family transcriptional regulator [Streptacidiphilus fuscans]